VSQDTQLVHLSVCPHYHCHGLHLLLHPKVKHQIVVTRMSKHFMSTNLYLVWFLSGYNDVLHMLDSFVPCKYLSSDLQRVSHLNARRRLRSSTTSALVVPRTVRSTIGDRTFPATAASVWNSLPESVRSSPLFQVFRSRLKTELFALSYSHD